MSITGRSVADPTSDNRRRLLDILAIFYVAILVVVSAALIRVLERQSLNQECILSGRSICHLSIAAQSRARS
jgi:hypothetical protein